MESKELDNKIKTLFLSLDAKLTQEEKRNTHFRSVANFVYHLVDHPCINPKRSPKLQIINEPKIKKKLLDYLEMINENQFTFYESLHTPSDKIYEIGSFMGNYYNFSMLGLFSNFFGILIYLTAGAVLDVVRFFIMGNPLPILTIASLIIFLLDKYVKCKQRRVFGVNY